MGEPDTTAAPAWVEPAFDAVGVGLLLHDRVSGNGDGCILRASAAMSRLLGYPIGELPGMRVSDFISGDLLQVGLRDATLIDRNGRRVAVEVHSTPVSDDEGSPVLTVVREGSECRAREAELRKALERYEAAVESASAGIWEWDMETGAVYHTPACAEMLGYGAGELGTTAAWSRRVHPDDLPVVSAALQSHLDGIQPRFISEHRTRANDGSWRWVRVQGQVVSRSASGTALRAVGAIMDISKRKQAEEEHKRDEYWLRESQRNARIGTYVLDIASGRWTSTETLDEIFGIGPDYERSVHGWGLILHPEDSAPMIDYLLKEVLEKRQPFDRQYRIIRRNDGQERWVHGLGALFPDAMGTPVTMVGTIQDITERRNMEQQLQLAQRMESVGQLAGGIAHDFNNLLTVINGYSDLLLARMAANDPLRAHLAEVRKAGERAALLTQQLLAFSRRQVLQPRVLDLNEVIAETRRMLERLIGENIHLVTRLCSPVPRIRADLGQINQVLINLVVNARDAMPEGGCLTLETSIESANPGVPEVCLGVSDTGHGMDRVTRERMFEPFYTTKPVGAGTGLGLATVYGIVQQSGGRIEVISEPGAGSTFLIRLPLVDGALEEAAQLPAVSGVGSGAATVLVVEDQAILRGLVCETLMSAGFQVLEAECGTEALAVSKAYPGPIELVLTDVVMPGMTGRAMAEQLVAARNGTRVLYMSGYGTNVIAKHGVLDEGVNFLQKPFSPGELVAKVQRILG